MKDFAEKLLSWYKKNARGLPWRKTKDPYKIWVSEVMLQQTTVNAVTSYYERWIKKFPTLESVALASEGEVLRAWQGLGYYQRVRNLRKSAQIILRDHNGRIPDDAGVLKKLPGFGPYTIGAVLSIAFDKRHPIIDANVRRVIMRQLALRGLADQAQDKKIYDFLYKCMPDKEICFFNQALMELGALVCRSREPMCNACPVCFNCLAFQKRLQNIIPQPRRSVVERLESVAAIIEYRGCYLIRQRPKSGLLAGLWEFPSQEVHDGEPLEKVLERLCGLELGGGFVSAEPFVTVRHAYAKFQIKLHAWKCVLKPRLDLPKAYKWIPFSHFGKYTMPSGCVKILEKLQQAG